MNKKWLIFGGIGLVVLICVGVVAIFALIFILGGTKVKDIEGLKVVKTDQYGMYYPADFEKMEQDANVSVQATEQFGMPESDVTSFRDNINLTVAKDSIDLNQSECQTLGESLRSTYKGMFGVNDNSLRLSSVSAKTNGDVDSCTFRFEINAPAIDLNLEQEMFNKSGDDMYYTVTITYAGTQNQEVLRQAQDAFIVR